MQAGVHAHVPLQDEVVIKIVRVEAAAPKEVVVARHSRVSRVHEVRARDELAHQFRGLAYVRMRGQRVVAGCHLQVEHGRQQVLGQNDPHPARERLGQRHATDGAVLHALAARTARHQEATRLKVQHGTALRVPHQAFGAGAGGEAHLDPARGVG